MFANRYDENPLANLFCAGHRRDGIGMLADASENERPEYDCGQGSRGNQSPRLQPNLPPPSALLGQLWRELLPDTEFVVFARVRHREIAKGTQHGFDALQFCATGTAVLEMRGDFAAAFWVAVVIRNQLLFRWMTHPSVPIALACARPSRKGSSACRNFCTARNTVFFAAPEFDFSTPAISSIPRPSQWRMTNAVRSAWESWPSARCISRRNWVLCIKRSGEGFSSRTSARGSCSTPSGPCTSGVWRRASSFWRWRRRSIA